MAFLHRHWSLTFIVGFLAAVNVLFWYLDPERIVDAIGVQNAYLFTFLLAAIGGISTVGGLPLFTTLAAFGAGGTNPLLLGIAGGVGIFISDSIFFHLALLGRKSLPPTWEAPAARFSVWARRMPDSLALAFVYLYISFTPFPNDVLMLALAAAVYPYRRLAPILLAGSLTIATVVAYLGAHFL